MRRTRGSVRFRGRVILGLSFALAVVWQAIACDTPVYRYAMYRWEPAPYEVYFFHDQPPGASDQKVAKQLAAYARYEGPRANVVYIPVDLAKHKDLAIVPPHIKSAFLSHTKAPLPSYLVAFPYGPEVYFGNLDEAAVQAMVASPAREKIADQLAEGKMAVLVVVRSKDEGANRQAESVVETVVREVKEGKIELYTPPSELMTPPGAEAQQPQLKCELGIVKIDPDDPNEVWLLRMLRAMEPELAQETAPMVFSVYGRGRAMLPYIGKGIHRDNLVGEIQFLSGACSCQVKEQNPGVDFLFLKDWDSVAMSLAEKFGAEEGSPGFYPELVIPSSPAPSDELASSEGEQQAASTTAAGMEPARNVSAPAEASPAKGAAASEASEPSRKAGIAEDGAVAAGVAPATAQEPAASSPPGSTASAPTALRSTPAPHPAQPAAAPAARDNHSSVAFTSMLVLGGGLAVALLALFGLTFYVLRPQ